MKTNSAKVGAASGCIIWLITFFLLVSCLVPVGLVAGGISSGLNADFVAQTLGPYMCPADSTAQVYTYATTMWDQNNFEQPANAYELRCLDVNQKIVKNLGPIPFFVWTGIFAVFGVVLAGLLAFVFAAPAGALIARFRKSRQAAV
jgi:hypothetical protein